MSRWWGRAGTRKRWSLRTRLVVSALALIAVVCAVIGTVTTLALQSSLSTRLDDDVRASVARSVPPAGARGWKVNDDVRFAAMPGQPIGTIGARFDSDGEIVNAARGSDTGSQSTDPSERLTGLTDEQTAALQAVPRDGEPHTVSVPGLGDYRVQSSPSHPAPPAADDGSGSGRKGNFDDSPELLVGLPMSGVQSTLGTLVVVELCVTGAGLVAAGLAGTVAIRIALRPLRRVAATATRVSGLPLHRGEVELQERVPERDTDPRTEVGQVGAALNRMLGHVGSALEARQESETRVRRFVADASHELRTPLASIRGYAELTRRGGEETGADTRHALTRIEAEAGRMTGLVEDLLLLARLDSGRPLERSPVDVSALVVDTVSDARAAGPGHVWRLELSAEPLHVTGDAGRLQQVVVNLLANARTHTPDGTAVTARVRRTGPGAVTLEVEDAGPGIPEELLPHIFERFARGDASRSRAHGSTGLGLAIVDAVVTAHGGSVDVSSGPGRTVFAVRLPVAMEHCDGVQSAGSQTAGSQTAGSQTARGGTATGATAGCQTGPSDSQAGHSVSTTS